MLQTSASTTQEVTHPTYFHLSSHFQESSNLSYNDQEQFNLHVYKYYVYVYMYENPT